MCAALFWYFCAFLNLALQSVLLKRVLLADPKVATAQAQSGEKTLLAIGCIKASLWKTCKATTETSSFEIKLFDPFDNNMAGK